MDDELKKFTGDIRRSFRGAKIMLFGSRANGTARSDSDYDLIIISKYFEKIPILDRPYEIWMKSKANIAADLLCYAPAEVNKIAKSSFILREALKHAVTI